MLKINNVVMLPTEKASHLTIDDDKNLIYWTFDVDAVFHLPQHLYFTSDEEIKKGDWIEEEGLVYQVGKDCPNSWSCSKKIIATTDELHIDLNKCYTGEHELVPLIPESFIIAYVKANGEIDKVMLEYELTCKDCSKVEGKCICADEWIAWNTILKTREDNTVIVHPVREKTYSKVEVIDLLSDFAESEIGSHYQEITNIDKWIEENL